MTGPDRITEEVGGRMAGVRLPRRLRFYDCRWPEDLPQPRAPWGETLWGSERAEYALGLKRGWWPDNDASIPTSLSGCCDTRRDDRHTAEALRSLRRMAAEALRDWRRSAPVSPLEHHAGGYRAVHRPLAVALCNYGGAIIADRRETRRYRYAHELEEERS